MEEFQDNHRLHSSHDVARTGVLLGLMIVLVLMGIFFPIIGGLALLIQPSILYLIAERSGLRTAVLSTVGVILLTIFLIGPFEALKASFLDILPSLVFVILMSRYISVGWVIFGTTIGYFLGLVIVVYLGSQFMGMSLSPQDLMAQTVAMLDSSLWSSMMSTEQIKLTREQLPMVINLIYGIGAFMLLAAGTFSAYITYRITQYIARRFTKKELAPFPPFSLWDFPLWMGFPAIIVYICSIYIGLRGLILPSWLANVLIFFQYSSGFLMLFQGLAVSKFLLEKYQKKPIYFYLLILFSFIIPIIMTTLVFIGVVDLFLNYRRLPRKNKKLLER